MSQQFYLDLPKSRTQKQFEADRKVQRMKRIMSNPIEVKAIDAIHRINRQISIENSEMLPTEILAALDGKRVMKRPQTKETSLKQKQLIIEGKIVDNVAPWNTYHNLKKKEKLGQKLTLKETKDMFGMLAYLVPKSVKETMANDCKSRIEKKQMNKKMDYIIETLNKDVHSATLFDRNGAVKP